MTPFPPFVQPKSPHRSHRSTSRSIPFHSAGTARPPNVRRCSVAHALDAVLITSQPTAPTTPTLLSRRPRTLTHKRVSINVTDCKYRVQRLNLHRIDRHKQIITHTACAHDRHTSHNSGRARKDAGTHKAQRQPHEFWAWDHLGMSQTDVSASHTQWCSAPYLSHVDSLVYDLPEVEQQIWPLVQVASW